MPNRKHSGRPKVLVVLGQTATGKSDFAVEIGKALSKSGIIKAEIISADSRQIYKGLDIGAGKITKAEMKGIPHHMIDIADPKKRFSVSEYKKPAEKKISEIHAKGKLPIIAGGTGFYIQTLVDDIVLPEVPPRPALRAKLEKKTGAELIKILARLDPRRAKTIDSKNKVRLIRAIEIARKIGRVPEIKAGPGRYDIMEIGLMMPDSELKEKIKKRLLLRIKKGMIKEAEKLHQKGLSFKRMKELGLEYRHLALFLERKISKEKMLKDLAAAIWQYAKRQKTWFKKDKRIIWINPLKKEEKEEIQKKIKMWINGRLP